MGNGDAPVWRPGWTPVAGQDESLGYVGIDATMGSGSTEEMHGGCTERRGSLTDFCRAESSLERYWELPP